jgi:hypothetical protein
MNNVKDHLQAIVDLADARLRDTDLTINVKSDLISVIQHAVSASECVGVTLAHTVPADRVRSV